MKKKNQMTLYHTKCASFFIYIFWLTGEGEVKRLVENSVDKLEEQLRTMFCQITESNSNAKLILVLVEFWAKIYFEELFDPQKCCKAD